MTKWIIASSALLVSSCMEQTSCVARGTLVLTPAGPRPIEELAVGDPIYSVFEETGELIETRVTAIQTAEREVGSIQVGSTELRLTTDHPVYCPVQKIYAPAGDWLLGKRTSLLTIEPEFGVQEVTATSKFSGVDTVFDITVEHELHNFVANSIVVHNKSLYMPWDAGPDAYIEPDQSIEDMNAADMSDPSDMSPDAADLGPTGTRGTCSDDEPCDSGECISFGTDDPATGWHTCKQPQEAAPGCGTIEDPDQCCQHTDCTESAGGSCVLGPIFYCGGAQPEFANVCIYDSCGSNADCSESEVCVPAGVFREPASRCVASTCETDADCTAGASPECNPFFDPCNRRFIGFHCTYESSECRSDIDCAANNYCTPGVDGQTSCEEFFPPP